MSSPPAKADTHLVVEGEPGAVGNVGQRLAREALRFLEAQQDAGLGGRRATSGELTLPDD